MRSSQKFVGSCNFNNTFLSCYTPQELIKGSMQNITYSKTNVVQFTDKKCSYKADLLMN